MLNQPEELKTLEQKIEDARNTLTVIEQDQIRVKNLIGSQTYTLEQQSKQKAELVSELSDLENNKSSLMSEISTLDTVIEDKNLTVSTLESEIINLNSEKETLKEQIQAIEYEIESKSTEVIETVKLLDKREKDISKKEEQIQSKLEIIKNFKQSL